MNKQSQKLYHLQLYYNILKDLLSSSYTLNFYLLQVHVVCLSGKSLTLAKNRYSYFSKSESLYFRFRHPFFLKIGHCCVSKLTRFFYAIITVVD